VEGHVSAYVPRLPRRFVLLAALLVVAVAAVVSVAAQNKREFKVTAHKYAFQVAGSEKPEIRVQQGDQVRITFSADDIPHSFSIDKYRIMRRAEPGKPVTFEFLADEVSPPGGFPIRCTLTIDSRCKEMAAFLIVEARK
jgi:heme/copper-type cytochrome/quinol oxidase subunit 2